MVRDLLRGLPQVANLQVNVATMHAAPLLRVVHDGLADRRRDAWRRLGCGYEGVPQRMAAERVANLVRLGGFGEGGLWLSDVA